MELNDYRVFLYWPLGTLPALFFVWRQLLQWIQSEKKKRSYVGLGFWRISFYGNLLLALHHLIQVQYPFALIQAVNTLIAWRNMNLIQALVPMSKKRVISLFATILFFTTGLFLLYSWCFIGEINWIRTPSENYRSHSFFLHLFGTFAGFVFSSRFWIQWWRAENSQTSELDRTFWYTSIIGALMLAIYAFQIKDFVLLMYNIFGLVPYFRNLVLIARVRAR